jgi:hypothetical protein
LEEVSKASKSNWYLLLPWHHAIQVDAEETPNLPNDRTKQ